MLLESAVGAPVLDPVIHLGLCFDVLLKAFFSGLAEGDVGLNHWLGSI